MMSAFGDMLCDYRREAGISQRELAARVGVSFSYISKLENGRVPPPSCGTVARLADALGCQVEHLLAPAGKLPVDAVRSVAGKAAALRFLNEASRLGLTGEGWEHMSRELRNLRPPLVEAAAPEHEMEPARPPDKVPVDHEGPASQSNTQNHLSQDRDENAGDIPARPRPAFSSSGFRARQDRNVRNAYDLPSHAEVLSESEWIRLVSELSLSPRQAQVIRQLLLGRSDKQIAWELGISVPTVRTHLGRLFSRFGVADRGELVLSLISWSRGTSGQEA
jgi:DNA-binding CsgD family transcriptional regulator/transcriptional regulator with XRE-family HTH domain